ncbi:SDR family oxidoreductase [Flavitalea sp. BT771]|uniref:SDR family oxidoreductase n=1 Tax=Flavitalea sp. BT771 TaxID=3063329 RepID=UPI0026E4155F|nr:SDR family oxidoreductase [Flavitalea sp. BT771]MDO6429780.1 SDR family oxidoreductase [Flavitalea sp. BT771]MDV6218092.1 SDR family oxidoreductase [Flavitalea sp. BT771]
MRVFVTGASGFVGSAVVNELIGAGHQVLGLARSDSSAERIMKAGGQAHRGDLDDLASLQQGAAQCEAVIHTAFNHDFSQFKVNCEADRRVIEALGTALAGSDRPLIITSGIGLLNYGRVVTEDDVPAGSDVIPRAASEEAATAAAANGAKVYIVRLPPTVHGEGDHGFVPMIINMAKQNGESAYIGEGSNRWPAVHRLDAAVMYRLIAERRPSQKVYNAVAEEGIAFRDIAGAIGQGLHLPVVGKAGKDAEAHFKWFTHFASLDCPASGAKSQKTLDWQPGQAALLEDLASGIYF